MNKDLKRFVLIGDNGDDKEKCIGIIKTELSYGESFKDLIFEKYKKELDEYNVIYIVSDDLKYTYRVSSFTSSEFMRYRIDDDKNLRLYHPVYLDICEHDERVRLSEILDIDLV